MPPLGVCTPTLNRPFCSPLQHTQAGVTTDTIDKAVHRMIIEAGAYPSPLNYGEGQRVVEAQRMAARC